MKRTIMILTAAIMLSACGQVDGDVLTPPTTEPYSTEQPAKGGDNGDERSEREDVTGDGAGAVSEADVSKPDTTTAPRGYGEMTDDTDILIMVSRREINAVTDTGDEYCKRGEVIFNAEVPAECYPEAVSLIDADTGEIVAEMLDIADFSNYGDSLMGDGVYCCRYTFDLDFGTDPDVSEDMTCRFYAEFTDEHGTHRSGIVEVDLYEPFSDKELSAMMEVDDAIDELLQSDEYQQMSGSEKVDAVMALLQDLAERGLIKAESTYYDGEYITIEYIGGGHMAIEINSHHHHDEGDLLVCN